MKATRQNLHRKTSGLVVGLWTRIGIWTPILLASKFLRQLDEGKSEEAESRINFVLGLGYFTLKSLHSDSIDAD